MLGDRNTKFFHLFASLSNGKNFIHPIIVYENVISSASEIKSWALNFLSNLFSISIVFWLN